MSHRPRKSSTCVTLVLIGAATLAGCSEPPTTTRKGAYASRQECLADWGDEKECDEQVAPSTSNGSSGGHTYWGPSFRSPSRSSGSSGSSRGGGSSGGHSVAHGGFGSHGSSAS